MQGKLVKLDDNAARILDEIKQKLLAQGIGKVTYSDCIRYLYNFFRKEGGGND